MLPFIIRPGLVEAVVKIATSAVCRLNLAVFIAGLTKSALSSDTRVLNGTTEQKDALLSALADPSNPWLLQSMAPMAETLLHGEKRGHERVGLESKGVGSIMAIVQEGSTASVIACPVSDLVSNLEAAGKVTGLKQMKTFFADIEQPQVESMVASCTLWAGTLQHGDVFYLPTGWLLCQKCTSAVFTCFQIPAVRASHEGVEATPLLLNMMPAPASADSAEMKATRAVLTAAKAEMEAWLGLVHK